jgi:aminopeptidase N
LKNEEFATKKQLLHLALETNELQVRQAAGTLPSIPAEFREEYETY